MKKIYFLLITFIIAFSSCMKNEMDGFGPLNYVYLINSGENNACGSISVYREHNNTITNDILKESTGLEFTNIPFLKGDILRGTRLLALTQDKGIFAFHLSTLQLLSSIPLLEVTDPISIYSDDRYIYVIHDAVVDKSYLTILSAYNYSYITKIEVGKNATSVISNFNKAFVATEDGIDVIDIAISSMPYLIGTIEGSETNEVPLNIMKYRNDRIYVSYSSSIAEINAASETVIKRYNVNVGGKGELFFNSNYSDLYFYNDKTVYAISLEENANTTPSTVFTSEHVIKSFGFNMFSNTLYTTSFDGTDYNLEIHDLNGDKIGKHKTNPNTQNYLYVRW